MRNIWHTATVGELALGPVGASTETAVRVAGTASPARQTGQPWVVIDDPRPSRGRTSLSHVGQTYGLNSPPTVEPSNVEA